MDELYIPDGINFECTGCANCCLEWPVPVTDEDRSKIMILAGAMPERGFTSDRLFRPLRQGGEKFRSFSHTLEKRADGRCEFLTEENRCLLHSNWGADSKPAMCRLFPYTFNQTPSGVYVSVSFASSGALFNSGRPLAEQRDFLEEQWRLFGRLFPNIRPDWSQTQLLDGCMLSWSDYLQLEESLLPIIRAGGKPVEKRLAEASRLLSGQVPSGTDLERMPRLEARPKTVDQLVLKALYDFYLPDDVFASNAYDLDAQALMKQFVTPPPAVQLTCLGADYSFQKLWDHRLGELDPESEDLLSRFVYCRVFAKLYFGAGFGNLSVLAGLHHLIFLTALVRMKIKMVAQSRQRKVLEFAEIAEIVRALERRLSQADFSRETVAVLEVLLTSPERATRVLSLAA